METLANKRINTIKRSLQERGITITPYGNAIWLHSAGVSYVVKDLLSIREEWLTPFNRTGRIEPDCDKNRPLYIGLQQTF